MYASYFSSGHAAFHLARAASLAPSPHNSQPWFFVEEGHDRGFEVHADGGRRLPLTDPDGRQAVVAAGAALFNARIAVRRLGFRPVVDLLPDPRDQTFLARIGFGVHAPANRAETLMGLAMAQRHTHRGPFDADELPEGLVEELCDHARAEGAVLQIVDQGEQLDELAGLVRTAERVQRTDPGRAAEVARCVGLSGVPAQACRHHPDRTLLAGRDYLGLARRYVVPKRGRGSGTGVVAVLTTSYDGREDWLRAGQALQRVLLYAAAHNVAAAFHTQPLELPETRADVRSAIAVGRHPQMILRLGHTPRPWAAPRRPVTDLLVGHTAVAARR